MSLTFELKEGADVTVGNVRITLLHKSGRKARLQIEELKPTHGEDDTLSKPPPAGFKRPR